MNLETAFEFNKKYIDSASADSFFKILSDDLDYYFFSHMHDVRLELLDKVDLISHFYDFFEFLTKKYNGDNVTRAYSSYYVRKVFY